MSQQTFIRQNIKSCPFFTRRTRKYHQLCDSILLPLRNCSGFNALNDRSFIRTKNTNRSKLVEQTNDQNSITLQTEVPNFNGSITSHIEKLNKMIKIPFHQVKSVQRIDEGVPTSTHYERLYQFDDLPSVSFDVYLKNSENTAAWIIDFIKNIRKNQDSSCSGILLYVGFEAFYDPNFEKLALFAIMHEVPMVFSPQSKYSVEYLQDFDRFEKLFPDSNINYECWNGMIIHLGSSHIMDGMIFDEDPQGNLQCAWKEGRMVLISNNLIVTGELCYRAGLSPVLHALTKNILKNNDEKNMSDLQRQILSENNPSPQKQESEFKFYRFDIDAEIDKVRVDTEVAETFEEVFCPLFEFVTSHIRQLDVPCYWDAGYESFSLLRTVKDKLAEKNLKLPFTRTSLVNMRNAAIGDSLHAMYATSPKSFPLVIAGDTAALLAGGISLINIYLQKRYGVIVLLNNRGMAIEDMISKRSIDGHQYQYDYVKHGSKKDIFTLAELKESVTRDVLGQLRDYCWGVSPHRAEAVVLNIDVQSVRQDIQRNTNSFQREKIMLKGNDSDIKLLQGRSFLDKHFGQRYQQLSKPRRELEMIIDVLHEANNNRPVKIQGCSAVEFMEIFSQLAMTSNSKLEYIPTATDLLATRTLLPSLVTTANHELSNFINENTNFVVFISNAVFGSDGLNNVISSHFEYGTHRKLIHLVYDSATCVKHYAHIGQPHRQFGVRPSKLISGIYEHHRAYENQILQTRASDDDCRTILRRGLNDDNVKAIIVDMGAPNLTGEALG